MWKYKIAILLLVFFLSLSLTACSSLANNNLASGPTTETNDTELHNENGTNFSTSKDNGQVYNDSNHDSDEQKQLDDEKQPGQLSNTEQLERVDGENKNIIDKLEDPSIAVLVNKEYKLGHDYIPEDLVTVNVPTVLENPEVKQLRKVAAEALYDMFEEAKKADIYLYARSGYRSYQTQVQIFNNNKAKHGEEGANRYSAKPGHSEHQTGLTMDVSSESVNFQLVEEFDETKEGKWLSENAHKYGFIIRYPKGMEDITGYTYEPWHIRYLGVELATAVYESGLTYEEFLDKEGIINEVSAEKIIK